MKIISLSYTLSQIKYFCLYFTLRLSTDVLDFGLHSESLEEEALRATPGDPLLIDDEDVDELTKLNRRLDKLSLHVYRLEEDNSRRSQREWLLYPLVMIYFVFKVGQWFVSK